MTIADPTVEDFEDLLSTKELAPTPQKSGDDSTSQLVKACPECGVTKTKAGIPFLTSSQVATHRANVHGYRQAAKKAPAKKAATTAKKTTSTSRQSRRSAADLIGQALSSASRLLGSISPAGAKALNFSAPATGLAIDQLIAGTRVDKVVQKAVVTSEKWELVGSALGLPIMVSLVEMNPMLAPVLEEPMRQALSDVLVISLPLLKKRRQKEQELTHALADLGTLDPSLSHVADPVGALLQGFFTPTTYTEALVDEEQ